jgi:hypothetical protein
MISYARRPNQSLNVRSPRLPNRDHAISTPHLKDTCRERPLVAKYVKGKKVALTFIAVSSIATTPLRGP